MDLAPTIQTAHLEEVPFSRVSTTDERRVLDGPHSIPKIVLAEDIYPGLIPAGCKVDICQIGVNFPSAKEASSHEDESTIKPSKANGHSGELEEITPKLLDAVDGRSAKGQYRPV